MPSIVPGFEYDIFISYRHKDNKYDGWITEFIDNLKKEIEATFKEDISIYFDVNPHDGLLETHDVGGSLKDKLKCLVFIPIISRTYCDTKCFAWNNEFLEFLKSASTDAYGLKIKLPNGNTASRVLPIRIHELDAGDKRMIETELEGPLRAIDFTFQAAGVNRPLRPKDDESSKGPGQVSYRDQINKAANAISDLIAGMQGNTPLETGLADEAKDAFAPRISSKGKIQSFKIPTFNKFQLAIAALTVSLILLALLSVNHFSEAIVKSTYKATILPPDNTTFTDEFGSHLALSPDGSMLVFAASDSSGESLLYLRSLNTLDARPLKGTEGAVRPFWSPDSRFIGFFAYDSKLKKIDIATGTVITLSNASATLGGSWNQEDVIIFTNRNKSSIFRVSANGGPSVAITHLDTSRHESIHRWSVFHADGKHFFFSTRINRAGMHPDDAIFVASLDTTFVPKLIAKTSSSLSFTNGYLVYYKGGTLVAHRFDSDKLQLQGDGVPVTDQVYFDRFTSNAGFSVSQNGLLAFQSDLSKEDSTYFIWHNRSGQRLENFGNTSTYFQIRISPDGKSIAFKEWNLKRDRHDIWLFETNRGIWTRFTVNGRNYNPVWSPDSRLIVYGSHTKNRSGGYSIYRRAADGSGTEESIFETKEIMFPTDWSRDGKFMVYSSFKSNSNSDVWILPLGASEGKPAGQPFPFLQTEFNEGFAVFSPDGRWIAYSSDESGKTEIYIRPFSGPGGKWQVSTKGGFSPIWRGDGKELFFLSGDYKQMMSSEIEASEGIVDVSGERSLFRIGSDIRSGYDVTSDGQKFLLVKSQVNDTPMRVTLVVNWLDELKMNK